jgi:hypothetical protein
MKRTIVLGVIFTGVIAIANGCSSTPPERDYHEYSGLHAGQGGSGDTVGTAMFAHDSATYPKSANPRMTPPAPKHNDVAELPED